MSLNSQRIRKVVSHKGQSGSALVVAIFILVVFAILAVGITKSISSSTDQNINEVLGTRALFAADSGNELVLQALFPLNGTPGVCTPDQQVYFATAGLEQCNVRMQCQSTNVGGINYYQIVSTGVCKAALAGSNSSKQSADVVCLANEVCVSRTIEVEAKDVP